MLPPWHQGLALSNPNIDALSKEIHLLQVQWGAGSMSGRMLHQAYQAFQVEVGLRCNIFVQSFVVFGQLATHGFFRNLWELLHWYGIIFLIYADFDILLLREHDRSLMDAVHNNGVFDQYEEATINRYHHFKGVHSIRDMVYNDGLIINPVMLTKEPGQSIRDFSRQLQTQLDHNLWIKVIDSLTQQVKIFNDHWAGIPVFHTNQMYGL